MTMKFQPQFDNVGMLLSVASIMILLYFGLAMPNLAKDLWVAFAFWMVGFGGSLGLGIVQRSKQFNLSIFISMIVAIGFILIVFTAMNYVYFSLPTSQDVFLADRLLSFAIGVCEELFFGVFILGVLINWMGFHPVFAIVVSSGVHSIYHIPNWHSSLSLTFLFFMCFVVARFVYVYFLPKVAVLLGAHGFWNLVG